MKIEFVPSGPKPRTLYDIPPNTFVKILSSKNIYVIADLIPFKNSEKPAIGINNNSNKLSITVNLDTTMEEHKDFEVLGELKITLS